MINFNEWAETWTMREPACILDCGVLNVGGMADVLPTEIRITASRLLYRNTPEVEDLIWCLGVASRVIENWIICREAWGWDADGNPTAKEEQEK